MSAAVNQYGVFYEGGKRVKQYLLGVVTAAMISGIVMKLLGNKGTLGAMGKLVAGLFLTFTVVSPLKNIRLNDLSAFSLPFLEAGQCATEEGKNQTHSAIAMRIKQGCEAYILDKAQALDVELQAEVTVSGDEIPVPTAVRLKGDVSPSARTTLADMIARELDIPKEEQTWN